MHALFNALITSAPHAMFIRAPLKIANLTDLKSVTY